MQFKLYEPKIKVPHGDNNWLQRLFQSAPSKFNTKSDVTMVSKRKWGSLQASELNQSTSPTCGCIRFRIQRITLDSRWVSARNLQESTKWCLCLSLLLFSPATMDSGPSAGDFYRPPAFSRPAQPVKCATNRVYSKSPSTVWHFGSLPHKSSQALIDSLHWFNLGSAGWTIASLTQRK